MGKNTSTQFNWNSEMFDSFIDNLSEGIFYKDLKGRYSQCNLAMAEEILGYRKEEVLGMTDEELLKNKYKDVLGKYDKKVIEEETKVEYDEFLINDHNNLIFIQISKIPYYNSKGKLQGIMGIVKDKTQVIGSDSGINHEGEAFYQLAQNIDEVFWLIKDNKLMYISPGYERIWERKSDWLYEDINNFRKNIYPEDKMKIEIPLKDFQNNEQSYFNEKYRIVRPDRNLRWVWERSFPIRDKKGKIICTGGIAEDITTQKIAEDIVLGVREAMVQTELEKKVSKIEEFEKIDIVRNEFLANLSHEIRTPINMVLTSLKMLELTENLSESKYSKLIQQNCYRLLRLINNMIDTTRLDVGFLKLDCENMDIVQVVREITLSVSEYAHHKNISVYFETEVESLVVFFDSDMMERIHQLISIQYMRLKGFS
jgi:PAS domain S-box-containing protein